MTAEDVYTLVSARTNRTFVTLIVLCCLVAAQIVAKVIIFGRVIGLLRQARALLARAEATYDRAATEGRITDNQARRLSAPIQEIKEDVKVVREKVVGDSGHSGIINGS